MSLMTLIMLYLVIIIKKFLLNLSSECQDLVKKFQVD